MSCSTVIKEVTQTDRTPASSIDYNAFRQKFFNAAHSSDPTFYLDGPYELDKEVVGRIYGGLSPYKFGTFTLSVDRSMGSPTDSVWIREAHYKLGDGNKVGMRLLPVVDIENRRDPYPPIGKTSDGKEIRGSEIVDEHLRKEYYGGTVNETNKDAPIFGLIAYYHPEKHKGDFKYMASNSNLKTENGMTHLGVYIGNGQTRNSPQNYHDNKWEVAASYGPGYPANIYSVKFKDVPPKVFNTNMLVTIRMMNEINGGPIFPGDYKFDHFRTVNLGETLAVLRAWVDNNWKRRSDDDKAHFESLQDNESYYTYCAEHMTIILNIALNLPQNEQGYTETYGRTNGPKLWKKAKMSYEKMFGEIPKVEYFKPLWKRLGYVKPTSARKTGTSLAWPPETTADLVANFISQYTRFVDVGPVLTTAAIMGFKDEVLKRMGVTTRTYLKHAIPIITEVFRHHGYYLSGKGDISDNKSYFGYLAMSKKGLAKVLKDLPPLAQQQFIAQMIGPLENQNAMKMTLRKKLEKNVAYNLFRIAIKNNIKKARAEKIKVAVDDQEWDKYVQFYSPPAIVHRVINGLHPYNKYIQITPVGTAIDAKEVIYNPNVSGIREYKE